MVCVGNKKKDSEGNWKICSGVKLTYIPKQGAKKRAKKTPPPPPPSPKPPSPKPKPPPPRRPPQKKQALDLYEQIAESGNKYARAWDFIIHKYEKRDYKRRRKYGTKEEVEARANIRAKVRENRDLAQRIRGS